MHSFEHLQQFSITDIPLTDTDMQVLSETVEILKQFKDFSLFSELGGIIQRLEDKVYRNKNDQNAVIHLDKNENLKGLNFLDTVYQSILKKIVLTFTYQSFSARQPSVFDFHAFILKEFNNRWFVVGRREDKEQIVTLALDRIVKLSPNLSVDYQNNNFNADDYYKDTYGVTVLRPSDIKNVELRIGRKNAPYVLTKPFHHSQQFLERYKDGSIRIGLRLHLNFEFERLILGFGDSMEVIKPAVLKNRIKQKLTHALARYVPT